MTADRDLIPLSRWAARISRAKRELKIEELLEHPHARALVRAMPAQDLYYLIKRVGLSDCLDLLELCHPRQVQGFLDLDSWSRDRLDQDRLRPWLEAALHTSAENVSALLEGLDPEIWVLFLKARVRIHDSSPEQDDALGDRATVESPDHLYLLEILDPQAPGADLALRLLLHLFKAETPAAWRRLFEAARIEIAAEAEEEALRFRRARLEDLGFVDAVQALEIYAYRDPERVKRAGPPGGEPARPGTPADGEGSALPAPYAEALAAESFFERAISGVDDDPALDDLARQLAALGNRVLAADGIDVGEPEAVQGALARMRSYLSLALEHLGDGDPERARPFLLRTPLVEIFQVGFSLTLDLQRRARRLLQEGWLARPGARLELLEQPDRELLAGLERKRPALFAGLTDPKRVDARDFETLEDVALARERLELIEFQGYLMLDALGLDPTTTPPSVAFATLFGCAFVHQTLGQGFRFDPVTSGEVQRLLRAGMGRAGGTRRLRPEAREEARLFVEGRVMDRGAPGRALARRVVDPWLDQLQGELEGLDPREPVDPRFLPGLWVAGFAGPAP